MKHYIVTFLLGLCCFVLLSACNSKENDITELSADKVYFFYQTTCPHCHTAAQYIKNKYPMLKVVSRDIKLPGNKNLFKTAVKKYGINGSVGTPLICFGDHYIMGWGPNDKQLFDYYVRPYVDNAMQEKK
jgi:glutaredoxin